MAEDKPPYVYIVTGIRDYEGAIIEGVFSGKKKAHEHAGVVRRRRHYDGVEVNPWFDGETG